MFNFKSQIRICLTNICSLCNLDKGIFVFLERCSKSVVKRSFAIINLISENAFNSILLRFSIVIGYNPLSSIIFSKPALFALNPLYDHLSIPVILLSLRGFFYVLTSFFFQVLLGIEKVDEEQNPSFKSLIKSKLFHLPTVNIIHHSLYIILLAVITIMLTNQNASDLELVVAWTSVSLFLSIPIFVYVFYLLKKHVIFSIQHIELFKYTIGTFGMIIVFIITSNYLISYEISIYNFLPGVITEFILCICTYLGITYLIDNKTRILFKAILLEFTSNK